MTDTQDLVKLAVRWSNVDPPLLWQDHYTPQVIVDDPEGACGITIWDWDTVPDALSVGLVVQALSLLGVQKEDIPADSSWFDLLALLGPDVFAIIDVEVIDD